MHWATVNMVATRALTEKNTSFSRTGFRPVGYREKYSACIQNIINCNYVKIKIFLYLNIQIPIESNVKCSVHNEADQVKGQIIKVQTDHTFSLIIIVNLRIKRGRPCNKVQPADHIRYINDDWRNSNCDV